MIPSSFDYIKANSASEALQLLATHGEDAKLLAGGHSLIPAMKLRLNNPTVLIDIANAGMSGISDLGDHIQIGACTTHGYIESDKIILHNIPMMAQAASMIGDPQVRNRGTIAGSLAHADPAADWPGVMIALDATIHITHSNGERKVSAENFFRGLFDIDLNENELITAISIPKPKVGAKMSYCKFPQPASRYAIVGCAVHLEMDGETCTKARIAMNGVSGAAYRETGAETAMTGKTLTAEAIAAAASNAGDGVEAMSDHFASAEYRIHLAKVFVQRALESC